MGFSRKRIIKIVAMLVFLCCTIFANSFAVRMMLGDGVDTYFYDKLLVAYTVGGANGLKLELDKVSVTDKLPREQALAKDFAARLATLPDPEAFLNDKVQKSKHSIFLVKHLRTLASIIMLILFGWQLMIKSNAKSQSKQSS